MTQDDAVTKGDTNAVSIDDQANYVPPKYVIGYVIAVWSVTWAFVGLALAAGIKLYDLWYGIVFVNLTMLIPAILAVVFNTLQRKPARAQLRPLTRHVTATSVIFAIAFPVVLIFGIAAICLVTGLGTLNANALGPALPGTLFLVSIVATVLYFPFAFGEEYGWRAYLLPALTVRHGKTRAATLVGLVWGPWHLAIWIYEALAGGASPLHAGVDVSIGIATAFAMSFPFAYCYFLSGNVLPCALLHVLYDDFLVGFVFAKGGLVSSGSYPVVLMIVGFALIPVFIWRFHRMETPWLPKGKERPYTPPTEPA